FIIGISSFIYKYQYLSPIYQVILIAVHILHVSIEAVRLVLGFVGNLGEKVPALSGFWITSLLLQLPISIFLAAHADIYPRPAEIWLYSAHVLFVLTQIVLGWAVIRAISDYHVRQFKAALAEEEEREGGEPTTEHK
ncbi:hypothetical protein PMAYCL1PPCAC_11714, partial [Pristionchus mayeri]